MFSFEACPLQHLRSPLGSPGGCPCWLQAPKPFCSTWQSLSVLLGILWHLQADVPVPTSRAPLLHQQERLLVLESSVTPVADTRPLSGGLGIKIPTKSPKWHHDIELTFSGAHFFLLASPPLSVEPGHLHASPCSKPRRPRITDQQLKGNLCILDSGSSRAAFQQRRFDHTLGHCSLYLTAL